MHLNRVEAIGFKSFANKVNIEFKPGINGIVGPNGCGKSNITDAIKWVLGEQSTKNLRASGMADVIFSGSEDYKKQNFAQVTLVFDNQDHGLKIDFEQVEITRRLYRSGESEYLINKSPSRLKDIVELIMDTGLGKDSLSMISQGAISNFAQAKPEERRGIFEEAAGVAKYKKRKTESLRKLEKTTDNLQRLADIIYELENQIQPLKEQAIKAKKYQDAKEKLEAIEISVLVHEINGALIKQQEIKNQINEITSDMIIDEKKMNVDEEKYDQIDKEYKKLNAYLSNLQQDLLRQLDVISSIEIEKKELQYNTFENADEEYINRLKNKVDDYKLQLDTANENKENFNQQKDELMAAYQNANNAGQQLVSQKSKLENQKEALNNRYYVLKNTLENKTNLYAGVKAILEQKNNLDGIIGIVKDLFSVEEEYANAVSKAIQAQLQNIVVENSSDAKAAIEFLKRNKAGNATFVPLDMIKDRHLNDDDLYIATKSEGFINVATKLIQFDAKYTTMFNYFLNNTLVVDTIDNAINLSKILKSRYRIVSLDGEVINTSGIITGGRGKNDVSNPLTMKNDVAKLEVGVKELISKIDEVEDQIFQNQQEQATLRNKVNQLNISIAKVEENISNTQGLFTSTKNEYEQLSNQSYNSDEEKEAIDNRLKDANIKKQAVLNEIETTREQTLELDQQKEDLDNSIRAIRKNLNNLRDNLNNLNIDQAKLDVTLKTSLDRLATEYKLTIENAREEAVIDLDISLAKEEVTRYKKIIKSLGNVNPLAIEEYQKVSERFEFLSHQKEDLETSRSEILNMINETDKIMVTKFKDTIEEINDVLPATFKKLFGGGQATLKYSDPTNMLETGIEIIAHPPGKSIQNLNLFSGGEKALIALAVLFAILKVRPIPLCILDEVEAALDQANVERFAKFLKDFSTDTQFIVITHRPGTMEECDVLYGVTMQEKGVTKMIGVQLEEAKEMIERE